MRLRRGKKQLVVLLMMFLNVLSIGMLSANRCESVIAGEYIQLRTEAINKWEERLLKVSERYVEARETVQFIHSRQFRMDGLRDTIESITNGSIKEVKVRETLNLLLIRT